MFKRSLKASCLGLALITSVMAGNAMAEKGYYKWLDSRGNPQHSDRPPPMGVEYEFVSTDTGMKRRVSAEESREAGTAEPPSYGKSSEKEPIVAEEKDPAKCEQAKANLQTLNSKARVRVRDEEGIRYLTEEEKADQRKRAENVISIHCGS